MKHYIHPKRVKGILFSLVIFLLLLTLGFAEENKTVRIVCSVMDTSSTGFNDDLYNKYESFDVASLILTEEEHEYANNLKEIKVGILDDYLPFSTEENGEVIGVVTYIADCIKGMTSDSKNLQISYKTYPTYLEMIQGLKDKEVNIIFPITSDFYYSELSQILESEEIFELPMSLIYRDYNENVTSKIAVTRHSPSQRIYEDKRLFYQQSGRNRRKSR